MQPEQDPRKKPDSKSDELAQIKAIECGKAWSAVEDCFSKLLKRIPESEEKLLNFMHTFVSACKLGEPTIPQQTVRDILRFMSNSQSDLGASNPIDQYIRPIYLLSNADRKYKELLPLDPKNTADQKAYPALETLAKETLEGITLTKSFFLLNYYDKREQFDSKTINNCDATIDRLQRAIEECAKVWSPPRATSTK